MINIFQNTKQYSFPQRSQLSLPSLAARNSGLQPPRMASIAGSTTGGRRRRPFSEKPYEF